MNTTNTNSSTDSSTSDQSQFEDIGVRTSRETHRSALSEKMGELLARLEALPAGERFAWYQGGRGNFFFKPEEIPTRISLINRLVPQRKEQVLSAAERIMCHEFGLLGSGPTSLGDQIDWHCDFKANVRWRNDVVYPSWNWRKVDHLADQEIHDGHFYSLDDSSDLKVPWDLSSFFHFPVLGEAFWQTGNNAFAKEILDQLRDWHEQNPFPYGVNWTCAMVVGIRLVNMIFGLRLIEQHPDYRQFMDQIGVLSILTHIRFVLDYLEVDEDGRRNNHYLNNLVGLAFGLAEIVRHNAGSTLAEFVCKEVETELITQFSADGTHFEGSVPYHRFAVESVLLSVILLKENGYIPSSESYGQLRRMIRFIDAYTKPNGLAPQIGDNDNGRILVLGNYAGQEYRDHRHILAVGASFLGLDILSSDVSDQSADVAWLLGRPALASETFQSPSMVVGAYADNGYLAAKTAKSSLIVRCGKINPMSGGGHNHCDQLSFELNDDGCDLVVDPGAFIYSADVPMRNHFRSTAAHNTLQLDDLEQQQFDSGDLFAMQDQSDAKIDLWNFDGATVWFRGHHFGYRREGWTVRREIRWEPTQGRLRVVDSVDAADANLQGQTFFGRLHLAAGIEATENASDELLIHSHDRSWILRFSQNVSLSLRQGHVSPSYGILLEATIVEYRFPAVAGQRVIFTLEPVKS